MLAGSCRPQYPTNKTGMRPAISYPKQLRIPFFFQAGCPAHPVSATDLRCPAPANPPAKQTPSARNPTGCRGAMEKDLENPRSGAAKGHLSPAPGTTAGSQPVQSTRRRMSCAGIEPTKTKSCAITRAAGEMINRTQTTAGAFGLPPRGAWP